jgi:predicted TIM-barrel fold metal-dependent hydrolase
MKYPDRFIGYVTVNPNYPDDMKNELVRCFSAEGMKGIKLHPSMHGRTIDYKGYHTAYEAAEEKGYPLLIHVWGLDAVKAVDRLAGQYPNAKFIMGHGGAEIEAMTHAIDVVNRRDNTYIDLALSMVYEGNVEWLVKEMGSYKVLYGSDMPFLDPRPAFGRVVMADISDEDKKNILGLNIKKILGI